jgi:hypothetical protein
MATVGWVFTDAPGSGGATLPCGFPGGTLFALAGLFAFPVSEDGFKAHPTVGIERGKGGANGPGIIGPVIPAHPTGNPATIAGNSTAGGLATAPFAPGVFEKQSFHFRPLSFVNEFLSRGFFVPSMKADFPVIHPCRLLISQTSSLRDISDASA